MYMWFLALNVYGIYLGFMFLGWNYYNINYKLIFNFNHHYSTFYEIMRRALIFTIIFFETFLFYTKYSHNIRIGEEVFSEYKEYLPLVIWVCFFIYLFFPSKELFNG